MASTATLKSFGAAEFHGPQTKEGRRKYDNIINPFTQRGGVLFRTSRDFDLSSGS
jgi:hypothetical protein